ncbi:YkoF family thiamine/hydroxymethylpyrimidine-binding protein [Microbacterium betulae]|uniref:YkoF family thiamine/hydroxymethylpyrimidine-binding protein n=1 Tax=Microbacterium betulae TaxID=2981139 RepID=A0AA97FGG4_9MICO|nr:YkoF family thiamine/hydroxymethylpyrimidine-binding protein [Microbacterium sp. AB]WOF23036.1 YkoF family thiamine/hydroxymethylpyrimidine-binding protein [Microbacterium sp. AB]
MTPEQTGIAVPPITPQEYGVGARFTLSVYDSDYVSIILGALGEADADGLVVETNDISTFVGGTEQRVAGFLRDVIAAAAARGAHLSASILLSRGCPGELQCELPPGATALAASPIALAATGVRARAHWSLYPLLDAGQAGGDHMAAIAAAVDHARETGLYAGSDHYATRLDGDLADVLETAANAWILVGRTVQHVTTHLTVSINSPSVVAG